MAKILLKINKFNFHERKCQYEVQTCIYPEYFHMTYTPEYAHEYHLNI